MQELAVKDGDMFVLYIKQSSLTNVSELSTDTTSYVNKEKDNEVLSVEEVVVNKDIPFNEVNEEKESEFNPEFF